MARPISVSIPHTLSVEEARRRIDEGFAKIERQISGGLLGLASFQNRWDGDRLHFEGGGLGQKINGRLDVLPNSVQIEIDLPAMLAAIADRVMTSLKKETQRLLEMK